MNKKDVIKHFRGVSKVAEALNIRSQSVSQWPEQIPPLRAMQIERITKGELKADPVPSEKQTA